MHVCLLEVESAVGRTVPDVQCASFFEKIEQPYRDILVLMRYTGLRLTEVLDLTWQQIDFNRNVIFIRSREVPLLPQALLVLKDLFNMIVDHKARVFNGASGSAIDPLELLRSFEQARLEDGLPITFSMIALRHFFVKDLFQRNISFLAIGKMLGVFDAAKLMVFASYIPLKRQDIVL